MKSIQRSALAAMTVVTLLGASGFATGLPKNVSNQPFPYDPLCRWGRLSDGQGFLLRCLQKEEALGLAEEGTKPGSAASSESASPEPELKPSNTSPATHEVVLGPIRADAGSFPKGVESLAKGQPKYQACLVDHGGITKAEATVEVRFLVQGRGRAEGAVVKKVQGMSKEAAKCIADVVDRRFVGYPEQEMVGATLVVTVKKR
jgi:hypothetical protein